MTTEAVDSRSVLLRIMRKRTQHVSDTIAKYRSSLMDNERVMVAGMLVRCEYLLLEAGNVAVPDKILIRMAREMGTILDTLDYLLERDIDEE